MTLLDRYREHLSISDKTPRISLSEGSTPLIPAPELSRRTKLKVYLKYEGANPTGSFKDRGMVMAVSKAIEEGSRSVVCASTGNTAASAAAYAARSGVSCAVLMPRGKVASSKLAQTCVYGARMFELDGNFDDALTVARELSQQYPITLVNSTNPYRIEGQATAAFEIVDELGDAPVYHALPVGNAGNITAYWRGYNRYFAEKKSTRLPKMLGFQAEGAAPIVLGEPVLQPETVATAIRIGNPASWIEALKARDESNGLIDCVSDEEILSAQSYLARVEGVFCEPASAASVAGVLKLSQLDYFDPGMNLVCVLTGNGLKDPSIVKHSEGQLSREVCSTSEIAKQLNLEN